MKQAIVKHAMGQHLQVILQDLGECGQFADENVPNAKLLGWQDEVRCSQTLNKGVVWRAIYNPLLPESKDLNGQKKWDANAPHIFS